MPRTYHSAASTGASSTTSSSDQTKVTLTFTPLANTSYAYIWSAQVQAGSTFNDVRVALKNGATTLAAGNIEDANSADWHPMSGVVVEAFGASPTSQTITLVYSAESSNTAQIREARIIAVALDANDVSAEDTSDQTSTSTTFATALTLTWTPPSSGDYLVLGAMESRCQSTSGEVITKLVRSSTDYGTATVRPKDTSNYVTGMHAVVFTGLSGSQTVTMQFARSSTTSTTVNCRRARLVALRLNDFDAYFHGRQGTRTTTTSASAQVRATTNTTTVAAVDTLVIGACVRDHNSTSNDALTDIATSAALVTATSQVPVSASTTIDLPAGMWAQAVLVTPSANATFTTRYYSGSSGTSTGIADAQIVALQLTTAGITGTATAASDGGGVDAAATLRTTATATAASDGGGVTASATLRLTGTATSASDGGGVTASAALRLTGTTDAASDGGGASVAAAVRIAGTSDGASDSGGADANARLTIAGTSEADSDGGGSVADVTLLLAGAVDAASDGGAADASGTFVIFATATAASDGGGVLASGTQVVIVEGVRITEDDAYRMLEDGVSLRIAEGETPDDPYVEGPVTASTSNSAEAVGTVPAAYRLLEDDGYRVLEDGESVRITEGIDPADPWIEATADADSDGGGADASVTIVISATVDGASNGGGADVDATLRVAATADAASDSGAVDALARVVVAATGTAASDGGGVNALAPSSLSASVTAASHGGAVTAQAVLRIPASATAGSTGGGLTAVGIVRIRITATASTDGGGALGAGLVYLVGRGTATVSSQATPLAAEAAVTPSPTATAVAYPSED